MIDPFHLYLSRRASARQADSKANNSASKQPDSAASTSTNSSVDSKSMQSSYIGGDGLSPTSTASTDQATRASIAGSSASSFHATALPPKLPELEHFRQSSPLMPEFYPRTSDFFTHGRRRSSIAVSPDSAPTTGLSPSGAVPSIPEASIAPRRSSAGNAPKKPDSFNLPLTFTEPNSLEGEQLPVRLGLAPPSHSHGLSASDTTYKARVGHGYYFYTPPPPSATSKPLPSSTSPGRDTLRRRNTDTENIPARTTQLKPDSPSSTTVAPGAAPHLPQRARASTSIGGSPPSTLVDHAVGSKRSSSLPRGRLPPPSAHCWDPEAYFARSQSRVKGKMRQYVYHTFPASVVPYWHGYNAEAMEAEMSIHLSATAALHGHTLRDFPEGSRPSRVLDLGCGRGLWCLDVAREWKTTEFVGLDIVPIQPPLHWLADLDLEHRVSWVIANFLEPLPFPDASFDYVHVRFLLQGVPEDKWIDLFSEARRVLAPGGVLEVVESNYVFFGQPSLIDVQELRDLEQGKTAGKVSVGARLPKRLKMLSDASDSSDVDAIEVVMERMMHRRFINPALLSVIPSALLLPGFSSVANGNPRHIPVYAESSAQRARARAEAGDAIGTSSATATSSDDESKRATKFTTRAQIGQTGNPLRSQFAVTDVDLMGALTILQHLDFFSSSRELVWAEAELEKRSLQGASQPELPKIDANRRFGQGNPMALKPFAHPWKSKVDFYKALDTWIEATRASADTEHLLNKYLHWEQAHEDLTVEGRKHAERRRKMSTSSVHIPSLGLDRLSLEDAVNSESGPGRGDGAASRTALASWSEEQPWDSTTDSTRASTRAASPLHAHEAPARLQSTRFSAPDTSAAAQTDTVHSTGRTKSVERKKKMSKRPSSSGSVGSSTIGAGSFGSFGRARTFGRGGAGNLVAAMPVPLPDAPSFMPGSAFAPPTADPLSMFQGPTTKASLTVSTRGGRGGAGGRIASGSNATSDSSGSTSRAEKDEPRMQSGGTVSSPAALTAMPISPAAAYAATQRVSHGLEDEYRFSVGPEPPEESRIARPVSPTTTPRTTTATPSQTPPARAATLGNRPPLSSIFQDGADPRSVSMPVTTAGVGVGSVRISEPLTRPSKDRSAKTRPKAVAMMGFLDSGGFLAIA